MRRLDTNLFLPIQTGNGSALTPYAVKNLLL
jgi:hypothetical protein